MHNGKHLSHLALPREGNTLSKRYRVLEHGRYLDVPAVSFNTKHGIDGIIRLSPERYLHIPDTTKRYTHFNLEHSGHRIGAIYALPKIVRHGYFVSDTDEKPPVLSFEDIMIARCVSVREFVPYKAITDHDFRYALSIESDAEKLKEEIVFRYAVSLPTLTHKDIVSRGVSVTTLRILTHHQNLEV
jgi:hypothetical protein